MISLNKVSYEASGRDILQDISFSINDNDRIGLVGANGVGKTTTLRLINGDINPTGGKILRDPDTEVGVMPQNLNSWMEHTVRDFVSEVTGNAKVEAEFEQSCARLETDSGEQAMSAYEKALDRYNHYGVADFEPTLKNSLAKAGLPDININEQIRNFSGGQRTRIALTAIIASHQDVILLDEPTNNLDQSGINTLADFMDESESAFVFVSHDRRFLRRMASRVIEIVEGRSYEYNLGYDEYVSARKKRDEDIIKHYDEYEAEKKRLRKVAKEVRIKANSAQSSKSRSADNDKLNANFRRERASVHLGAAASSLSSQLNRLEEPERPLDPVTLKFLFREIGKKKLNLLSVDDLCTDPSGQFDIGPISLSIRTGQKVLLSGPNGIGKTSLLKAMINPGLRVSGTATINNNIQYLYMDQNQTLPLPNASSLKNLQELAPDIPTYEAINLLLRFNINKQTLMSTPANELSGGERAKVLLAAIAAKKADLLIMDEPTNNLDIPTIEALEAALSVYNGGLLLVSHDLDFVDAVNPDEQIELKQ